MDFLNATHSVLSMLTTSFLFNKLAVITADADKFMRSNLMFEEDFDLISFSFFVRKVN